MSKLNDSRTDLNEETTYQANTEGVPTKELMKAARKRDYEKAKAARKADKVAEKARQADARESARTERDKALWSALKRGSDVDSKE
jgi:hypothetical protein